MNEYFGYCLASLAIVSHYLARHNQYKADSKDITDKDVNLILPNLYLGSMTFAEDFRALKALNITHVLMVLPAMQPPFPESGILYKQIAVGDSPLSLIGKYFEEAIEFIDQSLADNGCVLVHCARGASRSATIVCAYLIRRYGWTCEAAMDHVKARRSVVAINPGFQTQLAVFHFYADSVKLDAMTWANKLNELSTNFQEGEAIEYWDQERRCWATGVFLKFLNTNFHEVKSLNNNTVETSNLGLSRRPLVDVLAK